MSPTTSKQHIHCRYCKCTCIPRKWTVTVYNYAHIEEVNTVEYGACAFCSDPCWSTTNLRTWRTILVPHLNTPCGTIPCILHIQQLVPLQFLYTYSKSVYEWPCCFSTSFSPSLSWKASSLPSLNWEQFWSQALLLVFPGTWIYTLCQTEGNCNCK